MGTLPDAGVATALASSFRCEVPYVPELLALGPEEGLIASALRGLPGVDVDPRGRCSLHEDARTTLTKEPAAWGAFLAMVAARRVQIAKVQVAGPVTVGRFTTAANGTIALENHAARERITAHLELRVRALAEAVRSAGATPLLVVDEPALGAATHLALTARVVAAARDAGALVGVHCCGKAPWAELLAMDLDLLSFDVQLSLVSILQQREALSRFLARGARLSLGLIPAEPGAHFVVGELCGALEAALRGHGLDVPAVIAQSLLTPACGLAGQSVEGARSIFAALHEAQALLRALG